MEQSVNIFDNNFETVRTVIASLNQNGDIEYQGNLYWKCGEQKKQRLENKFDFVCESDLWIQII
jgi:hypothetical protein